MRRATFLISLGLVALTFAVYLPVRHYGFINFDDAQYVSGNADVQRGLTWDGLRWAATATHAGNWHPVTWLSHMLDVQWFGLDAGAHHLTNAVLHALNAVLLFWLLHRLTGTVWPGALVAALFAVHPLHVESVAWIAERKDVLSTSFMLLALGAWVDYVRRGRISVYALAIGWFALGLMSKPMLVTLPFVMLLLDVWPLERAARVTPARSTPRTWPSLVIEKLPFFALALASSLVTFLVQQQAGAVRSFGALPFERRVANAVLAYGEYLWKTVWPAGLAAIYPYSPVIAVWQVAAAGVLLVAVSALAWRARPRAPYLIVGWLWFLGTLVPVIGLVQVGSQPFADRYTYIPSIGLFIAGVWGLAAVLRGRRAPRVAVTAAAVLVVIATALVARTNVGYWQDSPTLWQHALDVTPENYRAHTNLGDALATGQQLGAAIVEFRRALAIKPDYPEARNYLGLALEEQGHVDDAMAEDREALRIFPAFPDAHNNLGLALISKDQFGPAVSEFSDAVRLNPRFGAAHANLGIALAHEGRLDEAIGAFTEAVALGPDQVEARLNLGHALIDRGRLIDALAEFDEAIRLEPDGVDGWRGRGVALDGLARLDEALDAARRVVRLAPRDAAAHYDLALLLVKTSRTADAVAELRLALEIDPANDAARRALAVLIGRD